MSLSKAEKATNSGTLSAGEDTDVHQRVARLSITVEDSSFDERQKFLSLLKEEGKHDQKAADGEADDIFGFETSNGVNKKKLRNRIKKKKKKLLPIESAIEEDETNETAIDAPKLSGYKRRRSSVAQGQGIVVRKKKFLNLKPELVLYGDKSKKATISSVRDLLLSSLTDMEIKTNWCRLKNRRTVDKFVVVFLRGLTNEEFGMPNLKAENDPQLIKNFKLNPHLSKFGEYFDEVIPMIAPGSNKCIYSTYSTLVSYSLSKKQKAAIQKENENRKIVLPDLYLSLDQLIFHNYPIHEDVKGANRELVEKTKDFKSTKPFIHEGSKTFALDCEMCLSETGRVVTRVSLIDFENNVLIDELIKPKEPIVDYLTQWSGITAEMLEGVETELEEVQEKILSIVSSNDSLIGHSLESDLNVLKIKHPNIIDTSVCYDHPRGPPSKASLKFLMSNHLDKKIQEKFTGHDSVEDCISCMELVKLKISRGYLYGKLYNMESLFKRIQQSNKLVRNENGERSPKSSVVIGYSTVKSFGHHELQIQCKNDDEVLDQYVQNLKDNDLIILKLRELEFFKGFSTNDTCPDLKLPETIEEMYEKTNQRLQRIYESLTPNSILVVCSENGDTREMIRLQKLSKVFSYNIETGVKDETFTQEDAAKLLKAVDDARDSVFLCKLKGEESSSVGSSSITSSDSSRDSSPTIDEKPL